MENLTGKDLLEKMKQLPAFEMDETKKQEAVMKLRNAQPPKPRWGIPIQRIGIYAALAAVFLIIPLLIFAEIGKKQGATGTADEAGSKTGSGIQAGEPDYFALMDENSNPVHIDTNFGIPEKASILGPKEWVANDYRGVGKVMVFVWGKPEELSGKKLKLTAVHKQTGDKLELADMPLAGKHYDADAHILTSFPIFPKDGIWELTYEVDNELFAAYPIYVKEPYIEMEKATLLLSQSDIFAGEYSGLALDVEGEGLPEEVPVKITNTKEKFSQKFIFKKESEAIRATDYKAITSYSGAITFLKSGQYTIEALGNKGKFEVRIPSDH